ncbi:MAG TPA: ATP synthase F1 subunit gamma [Bacteroidales bacterium]|nr:ATP synthase F1 subunit gamma [Bacteroidales bacterium]
MSNLKEVRTRLNTVKTLQQVSSAMRMVASSKLFKTQRLIAGLKPYRLALYNIIRHYQDAVKAEDKSHFFAKGKGYNALMVVITSNKGKCGAYNHMIAKKALDHEKLLSELGLEVGLMVIGKKGEEILLKSDAKILYVNHDILEEFNYLSGNTLADELMMLFTDGKFCRIDVVYGHFRNAVMHDYNAVEFLPLDAALYNSLPVNPNENLDIDGFDKVLLDPGAKEISDYLIPNFIKSHLYSLFLNAIASENGARMFAMQKASDNAIEVLKALTVAFNKERQSRITREIVEIVSGAESLSQG